MLHRDIQHLFFVSEIEMSQGLSVGNQRQSMILRSAAMTHPCVNVGAILASFRDKFNAAAETRKTSAVDSQ
jgi:hypothetical protein